jgi:hypothetical protein
MPQNTWTDQKIVDAICCGGDKSKPAVGAAHGDVRRLLDHAQLRLEQIADSFQNVSPDASACS